MLLPRVLVIGTLQFRCVQLAALVMSVECKLVLWCTLSSASNSLGGTRNSIRATEPVALHIPIPLEAATLSTSHESTVIHAIPLVPGAPMPIKLTEEADLDMLAATLLDSFGQDLPTDPEGLQSALCPWTDCSCGTACTCLSQCKWYASLRFPLKARLMLLLPQRISIEDCSRLESASRKSTRPPPSHGTVQLGATNAVVVSLTVGVRGEGRRQPYHN
jgi:hypothetical protein